MDRTKNSFFNGIGTDRLLSPGTHPSIGVHSHGKDEPEAECDDTDGTDDASGASDVNGARRTGGQLLPKKIKKRDPEKTSASQNFLDPYLRKPLF